MSLQWLRRWLWRGWRSVGLVQGALSWTAGNDDSRSRILSTTSSRNLLDETLIKRLIDRLKLDPDALAVADAEPAEAYPGTAMIITGNNFSAARFDNIVEVGGKPAFVVESSVNRLFVITDVTCSSGPIKVTVGADTVAAPHDFLAKPWPGPGSVDPAPPYSFFGRGLPGSGPGGNPLPGGSAPGSIPPTGTARVLVILVNPTDSVPPDPAAARDDGGQHLHQRAHVLRPGQLRHARCAGRRHRLHRRWSTTPITTTAPTARRAIRTSTRPSSTSSPPRRPRVRSIRASTWTTTA